MNMRGSVDDVRRRLSRLRDAMTGASPRGIDEALLELPRAIAEIQETGRRLGNGEAPEPGLKAALPSLLQEIGLTLQLADQGLALYRNRAAEIAALAGGYGATGLPAPVPAAPTIRIEG